MATERTRSIKSYKRKLWWRDNFLMVVMSIMLTAYFGYDTIQKQNNTSDHQAINEKLDLMNDISHARFVKMDNQLYTISIILINNPNTDPTLRDVLIEYVKGATRGTTTN